MKMWNIFEFEDVIDMCESCSNFLNRSTLFFSKEQTVHKPKGHRFIKTEAPFVDEIASLAIVKMLDKKEQSRVMLKLKFIRNRVTLDVISNTSKTVIFDLREMIGILDFR